MAILAEAGGWVCVVRGGRRARGESLRGTSEESSMRRNIFYLLHFGLDGTRGTIGAAGEHLSFGEKTLGIIYIYMYHGR